MVIWRLHIIWKCAVGWRVSTWLLHKSLLNVLASSTALLSPTIGLLLILSFPFPHAHLLIHGALRAQYVGDHFFIKWHLPNARWSVSGLPREGIQQVF